MNCLISEIIIKSCLKAFKKYFYLSGGCWADETPEYWYNVAIAEGLSELLEGNTPQPFIGLTLENPVSELIEHRSNEAARHDNEWLRVNGRADLTLWKEQPQDLHKWQPLAIIEVKRWWKSFTGPMAADVRRICGFLTSTKSNDGLDVQQFGLFVIISDVFDVSSKQEAQEAFENQKLLFHDEVTGIVGSLSQSIEFDCSSKSGKFRKNDKAMPCIYVFKFGLKRPAIAR